MVLLNSPDMATRHADVSQAANVAAGLKASGADLDIPGVQISTPRRVRENSVDRGMGVDAGRAAGSGLSVKQQVDRFVAGLASREDAQFARPDGNIDRFARAQSRRQLEVFSPDNSSEFRREFGKSGILFGNPPAEGAAPSRVKAWNRRAGIIKNASNEDLLMGVEKTRAVYGLIVNLEAADRAGFMMQKDPSFKQEIDRTVGGKDGLQRDIQVGRKLFESKDFAKVRAETARVAGVSEQEIPSLSSGGRDESGRSWYGLKGQRASLARGFDAAVAELGARGIPVEGRVGNNERLNGVRVDSFRDIRVGVEADGPKAPAQEMIVPGADRSQMARRGPFSRPRGGMDI